MDHAKVCRALGPYVPLSSTWEKRLVCNRVAGHSGPHQHRNPHSFAVIAEWAISLVPDPDDERDRRMITP